MLQIVEETRRRCRTEYVNNNNNVDEDVCKEKAIDVISVFCNWRR